MVRRRGRNRKSSNNPNSVQRDLPYGGVQTLPYLYHKEIALDWNRIEEWAYLTDDDHVILNPLLLALRGCRQDAAPLE
jgi:hypothetical protein